MAQSRRVKRPKKHVGEILRDSRPRLRKHVGEFLRNSHPRLGETRLRGGDWRPLLRRADQAAVATLVFAALVGMAVYWFVQGGHRGELIEIDRAAPLVARYQVDVNKADWPEFAELPDVGEILARRIVESRQTAGPFVDHGDLQRVEGIGPLTLEKMRPYLLPMPDRADVAGDAHERPKAL